MLGLVPDNLHNLSSKSFEEMQSKSYCFPHFTDQETEWADLAQSPTTNECLYRISVEKSE